MGGGVSIPVCDVRGVGAVCVAVLIQTACHRMHVDRHEQCVWHAVWAVHCGIVALYSSALFSTFCGAATVHWRHSVHDRHVAEHRQCSLQGPTHTPQLDFFSPHHTPHHTPSHLIRWGGGGVDAVGVMCGGAGCVVWGVQPPATHQQPPRITHTKRYTDFDA